MMRLLVIIMVAILVIGGAGGAYLYFMKPDLFNKLTGKGTAAQDSSHTAVGDSTHAEHDSLNHASVSLTDSLKSKLAWYERQLIRKMSEADSLQKLLTQFTSAETQSTQAVNEVKSGNVQANGQDVKELAKTFSAMNVKELAPILSDLDNQSIIQLYHNMSSRSRKNIFVGLPKNRAAEITRALLAQADN